MVYSQQKKEMSEPWETGNCGQLQIRLAVDGSSVVDEESISLVDRSQAFDFDDIK